MSAAPFNYRQSYCLPRGYSVEFTLAGGTLEAAWSPRFPHPKLGRKLLPHYQRARNEFLATLDVPMLVIDL